MNKKYQNGFFLFGLVVLIIMASQLDFRQAWQGIQHAGYWFVAVILLWAFLYMINTTSWYLIIDTIGNEEGVCRKCKVGFWWLYKITISAFALNYATPGGLMGAVSHHVAVAQDRHTARIVVGNTVCDDSHLQSLLVLAAQRTSLYYYAEDDTAYLRAATYHSRRGAGGHMVLSAWI